MIADLIQALLAIYEAGLAVWDLSTETLLLNIGHEISQVSTMNDEESKEHNEKSALQTQLEQQPA